MALPTTILSDVGYPGHHPPFKSSGGNFYAIATDDVVTSVHIEVFKATDPTDSWTVQDAADNPILSGSGLALECIAAVQDGDVIHIITGITGGAVINYQYHQFNMATDNWDIANETIENTENNPTNLWCSIAVRSDGDVIVAYAGDTDQNMGGKKERVDYGRREGGSWGGNVGIALDAGGDVHYGNPNVVKGPLTDDMHFIWQQTTDTADPPTAWVNQHGRTLDSGNTLSTLDTQGSSTTTTLLGIGNHVSYDDSGTQRIINAGSRSDTGRNYLRCTEDGSDNISLDGSTFDLSGADPFSNGEVGVITLVELNGDLHVLYSGGGTNGVDQDLFYTTSTSDGFSWVAPSEEIDAITVNFISANIYGTPAITSWKFPGTMVGNRAVSGSSATTWTTPDNAKADDGSNAEILLESGSEVSKGLAASNFDFSAIPADSIIHGIEVRFGDYAVDSVAGTPTINLVRLILADDSDGGEDKSAEIAAPTVALQTDEAGGSKDLWGESFTATDVKDVDFGFFISYGLTSGVETNFDIDFMQMRIFYSAPPIVLAYIYDDGAVQKYNEKILIAGAVVINPAFLMKPKSGVRYY